VGAPDNSDHQRIKKIFGQQLCFSILIVKYGTLIAHDYSFPNSHLTNKICEFIEGKIRFFFTSFLSEEY